LYESFPGSLQAEGLNGAKDVSGELNSRENLNQIDRATEGCIASRELEAVRRSACAAARTRVRRVLLNPIKATPQRASHIGSGAASAPSGIQLTLGVCPATAKTAEAIAVSRMLLEFQRRPHK
jgi:hypothetical protein